MLISPWLASLLLAAPPVAPKPKPMPVAQTAPATATAPAKLPPAVPKIATELLPKSGVRVEIADVELPTATSWPTTSPAAVETFTAPAFAFSRIPHRYIDTGVRVDRPNPFLMRVAAKVTLPAGTHRFVLRGRGAARLWIDGALVLETPFPPSVGDGSDGRDPSKKEYLDLGPDFRYAPPGNREKWTSFRTTGSHLVILETIVGGKMGKTNHHRPDLGETVVAVSLAGTQQFTLLGSSPAIPYTDAGWNRFAEQETEWLVQEEANRRKAAFATHSEEWNARRDHARNWLASTPEVAIPTLPEGYPAQNAVDHFIAEKIADAKQRIQPNGKIRYGRDIQPILAAKCFSCHQGNQAKADLRLDRPSDSIVPGKPAESELLIRVHASGDERMPPQGEPLSAREQQLLKDWIAEGAAYQDPPGAITARSDDLTFLRRLALDTVGVPPTLAEIEQFQRDPEAQRREQWINRYLNDPRHADHWMGYWQDLLAENPNILNPTLNNTGPFRWWIYESMRDHKPLDVMVTELIRMRGSVRDGGPAGFSVASSNDVPMAEKGVILAGAFLGTNMRCARCHDSPANSSTQKQLFQIAAMLQEKPIVVPKTSSVPQDKLHTGRKALIRVTLKPGTKVDPAWPFDATKAAPSRSASTRDQLAAAITAPENTRFAEVMVNRIWKRLMGRGIVEPVDDWERGSPSHPELLRYLAREFVRSGYDLRTIERLILRSHAYQRAADANRTEVDAYFSAPIHRRLTAEQIVDSLFATTGKSMGVGEINLDVDGGRDWGNSISLGVPRRSWEFASTSNERDRPSLSLPRVQAVVDVLSMFGWRAFRPDPTSERDVAPEVLQPAILSNGTVAVWVTRLSDDHGITQLALDARSPEALVDALMLRILTRPPTAEERASMVGHLQTGFAQRVLPPAPAPATVRQPPRYVSWSNHLTEEANRIKAELEIQARRGDPPSARLESEWRQRLEDVLWAILNSPEMVFTP
ncbi:Uncharacterized protein OS=Singulisphaera acidiphila (strain ATCC BAA-1392 / DSM 18658 / VKM B-2454 / MOB10) GN=Sinac_0433 PE=4 SV=1: PSCyt1: PSCyt2: PSD1 [Tuwongella immobilis]|uniref:Cytochrome c domain-containing protein n=2 Tax=Tuwongella immobilis TaxID=692036 RepID=A0A6C2YQK0_9BACT|nr:Uncharacterized protein OS=Singulisphaera acidiphila (strain ATCC BAA-1392 / DSM 18658 / VKM B-2454 / MOB10) GN=Sinac_0433 PE=4 SV=1: PSCyt1: PSCyt2: PSD1 [Tuwongella immobilis]VTS04138.1 Uncharacterized protein OS=Singulisphaera acidiphila (strain ATCC BAA-1392 / DSM 18658 / VKM B-2454 / MOB10) GN=Sinac_0433 PE=4 SV=1: PSCyt1: PSCyt2: PSD1 [Tuwongella immobilis]